MSILRPEAALLLCCARTQLDSAVAEQMRTLLNTELEWPWLLRQAEWHRLVPLVSRHLQSLGPAVVPPAFLYQLKQAAAAIVQHNLNMTAELRRLLQLFEAHAIPALAWKGPLLALTAYGNLALRQFGDLDILVSKPHIIRARQLMLTQGYIARHSSLGARLRLGFHYHWDLRHPERQVTVDLHWAFVFGFWFFPWRLEHIWERVVPLSLAGTCVPNLPPEELLILLCLHGGKHHWKRIGWICDVAQVIRACPALDWERVMELAADLHRQRSLGLGLQLARELLAAPVPETLTSQLQADPGLPRLVGHVWQLLFSETAPMPEGQQQFYRLLRERKTDGIRDWFVFASYKRLLRILTHQ